MDIENMFKQAGKGIFGRNAGAIIGQILIPVPGLGALIGAAAGGFIATGKVTSAIPFAGFLGDTLGVAGDALSGAGDITSSAVDVAGSSVPEVAGSSFADTAQSVTHHSTGGAFASTIHGGPEDTTIHGGVPTDIQGHPTGGTIYGPRPTDIQGTPYPA